MDSLGWAKLEGSRGVSHVNIGETVLLEEETLKKEPVMAETEPAETGRRWGQTNQRQIAWDSSFILWMRWEEIRWAWAEESWDSICTLSRPVWWLCWEYTEWGQREGDKSAWDQSGNNRGDERCQLLDTFWRQSRICRWIEDGVWEKDRSDCGLSN